nr:hypothetical protein BaRGS_010162 [Batillaria attramentaria]
MLGSVSTWLGDRLGIGRVLLAPVQAGIWYVSLSDNEKTGYKARELKSVHVDAVGRYLRLNIHKNHINKHNLYNQDLFIDVNDNRAIDRDPVLEGYFNKPDYISPLDDLAFDMYQDPEIAQIIRKLERKKQEAVLQERYDYAKRLKVAIQELQKVGEKLGKMEVEKRQAVENEDYDKAKVKKLQMDEYRLQVYKDLNVHDLLESTGVSKAYSKTWSYREDALLAVHKQMQDMPPGKDDARLTMRAAVFLVKRGIDDKVYAASRNRDDAKKFVLDMAEFPEVKPTQSVPHECVKPIKLNMAPRLAQSRAEILELLYKDLGLNNGLTLDNMMGFCTVALQHNAGEVREVTERIIKQLYRDVGAPVKNFLPPDDEKTRKNTLWRMLFEYFDKVDGKPSKTDLKKQKAEEEAKKQAEIDALQKQLQELRQLNAAKEAGKEEPKQSKVVEIATYTDHLLTECEAKSNFGKCPRCTEAIPRADLDQHIADKTCNPAKSNMSHCPLCHENVSSGEDGWKDHLMTRDGCKQNPRRLITLNKQPAAGGKAPARQPASKIAKPTKAGGKTPR